MAKRSCREMEELAPMRRSDAKGEPGGGAWFCGHMENAIHALPRLDNWLKKKAAAAAAAAAAFAGSAECVHIYICDCHIV